MSVNEHAGQTCASTAGGNNLFERASGFACTLQPSSGRPQIRSYVGPGGRRTAFLLTRSTVLRGKCDDGLIRVSQISTRTPIVTITTQRNSSSPCHQLQGPHTKTLSYVSHFRAPFAGSGICLQDAHTLQHAGRRRGRKYVVVPASKLHSVLG